MPGRTRPEGGQPLKSGLPGKGGTSFLYCPRKNLYVIVFIVVLFGLWANLVHLFPGQESLWKYIPPFNPGINVNENTQLGAEYDFIARALWKGRGFSDPFGAPTGPTAWMPPLYPLILALLYVFFNGNSGGVAFIVVLLSLGTWILIGYLGLRLVSRSKGASKPWVFSLFYAVLLIYNFKWLFQMTHDIWLIAGMFMVVITVSQALFENGFTIRNTIAWGVSGSLAPLVSLNLGLVWGLLHLWMFFEYKKKSRPFNIKAWTSLLAIALVPALIWTARNRLVFRQWIPIKSNLGYDACLANWISREAVVTDSILSSEHPVSRLSKSHWTYLRLGEKKFCEEYRRFFISSLNRHPGAFFKKIVHRFLAVFFLYHPENPRRIMGLNYVLHPLLGGSVLLFFFVRRKNSFQKSAVLSVLVFLLPYIFISYYGRYYSYLLGAQALIFYWLGERLWKKDGQACRF